MGEPHLGFVLADHLRPELTDMFWERINLDLIGAHLINFGLIECHVHVAGFVGATFTGNAWIMDATSAGNTRFVNATFIGGAQVHRAGAGPVPPTCRSRSMPRRDWCRMKNFKILRD
ncbi:hypothetical protein AB0F52_15215 [Amycolatopsis sp. NPDC024027]|uniref:hypothetical protein n=1 Tax=Amycolatopsis sp. NPDC024027 TaxID=3154327 RepID=UPI0033FD5E03